MIFNRRFKKISIIISIFCLLVSINSSFANYKRAKNVNDIDYIIKNLNRQSIEQSNSTNNVQNNNIGLNKLTEEGNKFNKNIKNKEILNINELIAKEEELPLKLHNLIDLALERNLETKQAYINVKLAEYNLTEAKANYYPTIRISGNYSIADDDNYKETYADGKKYLNGSISASYNLFAFGKYKFNVNSIEHALNSMKYKENNTIQEVIFSVVENYYKLLSLKAEREVAIENENLGYETLKAANLKYKLGIVPLVDKLKANTAYSENKLNTIKVENEIKKQKANLNIILNLDPDYVLYIENPEIKIKSINKDISYFMEEARLNRPDLKILYEQKKQKEQELNGIKTQFLPEFTINGGISTNKDISKGANKKVHTDSSVSLNVSIPIFNGFSDVASIKAKTKEIEFIDRQIEQLEKQISNEVWSCYQDFNTNQVAFIASKDLLKSAEENAKINFGMYKNGKASILEVLDSQSQLKDAKMEFINAKYNWIVYKIKLLKTIGKMNLNNIINIGDL